MPLVFGTIHVQVDVKEAQEVQLHVRHVERLWHITQHTTPTRTC